MDGMTLELRVDVKGQYGSWAAIIEIPELYRREFESLKTCDGPLTAYVSGDVMLCGSAAKTVMKARKDSAGILAKALATLIVSAMERHDTHNGYSKVE